MEEEQEESKREHTIDSVVLDKLPIENIGPEVVYEGETWNMTPWRALVGEFDEHIRTAMRQMPIRRLPDDDIMQICRLFIAKKITQYNSERSSPRTYLVNLAKWMIARAGRKAGAVPGPYRGERVKVSSLDAWEEKQDEKFSVNSSEAVGTPGGAWGARVDGLVEHRNPENLTSAKQLADTVNKSIESLPAGMAQEAVRAYVIRGYEDQRDCQDDDSLGAIGGRYGLSREWARQKRNPAREIVRREVAKQLGITNYKEELKVAPGKLTQAASEIHTVHPETITVSYLAQLYRVKNKAAFYHIKAMQQLGFKLWLEDSPTNIGNSPIQRWVCTSQTLGQYLTWHKQRCLTIEKEKQEEKRKERKTKGKRRRRK